MTGIQVFLRQSGPHLTWFIGISLFANREMHANCVHMAREMVPYPAATRAVPGGLPGRGRLRAVELASFGRGKPVI